MNPTIKPMESVTLYYREGSSDKVYQCCIEPSGDLFVVNFAYGRRGTALQTGSKTSSPVVFEEAKKTYDKLVREKTAKGYTSGENGTPYQHTDKANEASGILPQLLNAIDEQEVNPLVTDKAWCAQEKKDGRRLLLKKDVGGIVGVNKKGLVIGLASSIILSAQEIGGYFVMDGECVGDALYVFDILERNGQPQQMIPYQLRLQVLTALLEGGAHPHIELVETAFTATDKALLLKRLRAEKREGIVFKRLDALYTPGRPNSGGAQLKHKFYATLSAVVAKVNQQRSVELRLLNGEGWVTAGNVTIPPNHDVPKVGVVVEVRYLYAIQESGSLYQPVYLGVRKDVEQHECVVSQLKFKGDDDES